MKIGTKRLASAFILTTSFAIGSITSAWAYSVYSYDQYASAAGKRMGFHAGLTGGTSCQHIAQTWSANSGNLYLGAETILYRTNGAIANSSAMRYSGGAVSRFDNAWGIKAAEGRLGNHMAGGKAALYDGNGYSYWWINKTPMQSC